MLPWSFEQTELKSKTFRVITMKQALESGVIAAGAAVSDVTTDITESVVTDDVQLAPAPAADE